jgi:hypothetical protein
MFKKKIGKKKNENQKTSSQSSKNNNASKELYSNNRNPPSSPINFDPNDVVPFDTNSCCNCVAAKRECDCFKPKREFIINHDYGYGTQNVFDYLNAGNGIYSTSDDYKLYRGCISDEQFEAEQQEAFNWFMEKFKVVITSVTPASELEIPPDFALEQTNLFLIMGYSLDDPLIILTLAFYVSYVDAQPYCVANSSDPTSPNGTKLIFVEHRFLSSGSISENFGLIYSNIIGTINIMSYGYMQFYKTLPNKQCSECKYYKYYKYQYNNPLILAETFFRNKPVPDTVNYSKEYLVGGTTASVSNYNFLSKSSENDLAGKLSFVYERENRFFLDDANPNFIIFLLMLRFKMTGVVSFPGEDLCLTNYLNCQVTNYVKSYNETKYGSDHPVVVPIGHVGAGVGASAQTLNKWTISDFLQSVSPSLIKLFKKK